MQWLDPLAASNGTTVQRTRHLIILMLWWLSLGQISIESVTAASVTLLAEFIAKLLGNVSTASGIQGWTATVARSVEHWKWQNFEYARAEPPGQLAWYLTAVQYWNRYGQSWRSVPLRYDIRKEVVFLAVELRSFARVWSRCSPPY